ncbi:Nicotinamide N-methyltransferase-like, partial [Aphelenchoides avenae]
MSDATSTRSLKLSSGRELVYLSEEQVGRNLKIRGFSESIELCGTQHSDLVSGVYEGGLKLWECAVDLCNYIEENAGTLNLSGKRVLELGCGAGLPSILAVQHGATHATLQDYNECVLKCLTEDDVRINNLPPERFRFVAGKWEDFSAEASYDIILTSETIYNEENYASLHDALDRCLSEDGIV